MEASNKTQDNNSYFEEIYILETPVGARGEEPLNNEEATKEMEASTETTPDGKANFLYKPTSIKTSILWQCIWYVAPSSKKGNCKSSNAISAYCMDCKIQINYNNVTTSKSVQHHMEKYPHALLEFYGSKPARKRLWRRSLKTSFQLKMSKQAKMQQTIPFCWM